MSDGLDRMRSAVTAFSAAHDVTGCFLKGPQYFAQGLEGEPAAIEELVRLLEGDHRDLGLEIVQTRMATERLFDGWHVGLHEHATYIDEILSAAHSDVLGAQPAARTAPAFAVVKLLAAQSRH